MYNFFVTREVYMKKDIEKSILVFAVSAGVVYVGCHCYQYLKKRLMMPKYIEVPYPVEDDDTRQPVEEIDMKQTVGESKKTYHL